MGIFDFVLVKNELKLIKVKKMCFFFQPIFTKFVIQNHSLMQLRINFCKKNNKGKLKV